MKRGIWIGLCVGLAGFMAMAAPDTLVPCKGSVITLRSGNYEVHVNPATAWTPCAIRYDGIQVGLSNGFYGAVLWTGPAKFIGTGHREGGVEMVTNLSLFVDGEARAVVPGAVYAGNRLVLTKRSLIDHLGAEAVLSMDANGVGESLRVTAVESQSVEGMYVFMHPFTTATREWVAGKGTNVYGGELRSDNDWELRRQVEWVSLYSPADELGVVVAYPEAYEVAGIKNGIWDLTRYHKLYLQAMAKRTFTPGETQAWSMRLRCFRKPPGEWRAEARRVRDQFNVE